MGAIRFRKMPRRMKPNGFLKALKNRLLCESFPAVIRIHCNFKGDNLQKPTFLKVPVLTPALPTHAQLERKPVTTFV
jgi:hypothetical protein